MAASGSERRQRTAQLVARFNEAEAAAVLARADNAGVSVAALIRHAVLHEDPPPRSRRPPADRRELAQLLGAVGRIGANVNQLAHRANAGGWPEARLIEQARDDIRWMRATLMRALGVSDLPEPPPSSAGP